MQVGKPTDNWEEDVEGKPETRAMKAVCGVAKKGASKVAKEASKVAKVAKESGITDIDIVVRAADLVKQQVDADEQTSLKDRAKLAGK